MMTRRSRIGIVLVVLALCVPLLAEAKLVLYSFEEMVLASSSIIIGEVQSISGGLIRKPRAKVVVLRPIRGTMPESPLVLRYGHATLTIFAHEDTTKVSERRQYIMFLTRENHKYRLVGADAGVYEIDGNGQVCDDGTKISMDEFVGKILAVRPKALETQK